MKNRLWFGLLVVIILISGVISQGIAAPGGPNREQVRLAYRPDEGPGDPAVLDADASTVLHQRNKFMDLTFWTTTDGKPTKARGSGWSPILGDNGDVLFVGTDWSLNRLNSLGEQDQILPPGQVAGFLRLDPSHKYLAYAKPIDLAPGSTHVGKYGVEILDVKSHTVVATRTVPGHFTEPVGWIDDRLLITEWDYTAPLSTSDFFTMDVSGRIQPFVEGLPLRETLPKLSPDRKWLAYQKAGGTETVLLDMESLTYSVHPDLEFPRWTPQGLMGFVRGQRVHVDIQK